ncbi:MAG TPA: glycosyl transferase family 90 [Tenuifilaceae bacterium]|nr:glycosyl transferase family 90 [Tenuifilaceae bacterium]
MGALPVEKHKRIKIFYYLKSVWMLILPKALYRRHLNKLLSQPIAKSNEVQTRVNYYNKLADKFDVNEKFVAIRNFKRKGYKSAYFFDTLEYVRYFNASYKFVPLFGDITYVPEVPSLLKSRPLVEENENSVLFNLNKFRHFHFINDKLRYADKIDKVVWRGHVSKLKTSRINFLEQYSENPRCDVGYTNNWKEGNPRWKKGWMSIADQLNYKFILCLEGVDVATNLKWAMSSNSVAVSTKPNYETWFMEGKLKPDYHYIEIADDFSNLEEKLDYYLKHPKQVEKIISNAHEYIGQFTDKKREKIISLLVLDKYFSLSNSNSD